MSQELERVYTINLGKVLLSPNNRRAKRAINMIREFARHHMKTEDVRIDEDLAHQIWKRGIKHPPRKVRVRMTKTEEGYVLIAPYEEELETKVTPEEKPTKLEEKAKDKVKPKEESKEVAAKVEEKVKKEVIEKPKKAPAKEKPKKAPAKEEKPKLAGFVDPEKGAQHYVDRYNKEKKYKDWFHKNYPQYSSIYEAVGLEEPKEKPKKAPAKEEKPKKKSS
ncbi:MAG: 50S ribosomal protein L31e (modular protein) [Nitrosopumilales archaeon]|nr:MAG: 50S ribosomal protein L31e (modular protein) [Nitrosopumilales archaeon]